MMTDVSPRGVHFAGTIKVPDERPAPEGATRAVLDSVVGLPLYSDSEIGPRKWWVRPYIDGQNNNSDLFRTRSGGSRAYQDISEYAVRPRAHPDPAVARPRYDEPVDEAWQVLSRLRHDQPADRW